LHFESLVALWAGDNRLTQTILLSKDSFRARKVWPVLVVVLVSSMRWSFRDRDRLSVEPGQRASHRCVAAQPHALVFERIRRRLKKRQRADPALTCAPSASSAAGKGHVRRLGHEAEDDLTSLDPTDGDPLVLNG
jgi:hypothetical protein